MAWRPKYLRILLVTASAAWSALSSIAVAQQSSLEEMRLVVVRSAEPGCEPVCPEWISAEGEITRRSDDRFREMFRRLGKRRLPIILNSPGGNVEAAMLIGNLIRERKVDVAVGKTDFIGCAAQAKDCKVNDGRGADYFGRVSTYGAMCNSACPLALAGGVHRIASPAVNIGLHQITTTVTKTRVVYQTRYRMVKGKKQILSKKVLRREKGDSVTTYEMSRDMERKLRAHFDALGVDPSLVDRMKQTKASELSMVREAERYGSKLVERNGSLNALVSTVACKSVPASSNCRLVTTDDV